MEWNYLSDGFPKEEDSEEKEYLITSKQGVVLSEVSFCKNFKKRFIRSCECSGVNSHELNGYEYILSDSGKLNVTDHEVNEFLQNNSDNELECPCFYTEDPEYDQYGEFDGMSAYIFDEAIAWMPYPKPCERKESSVEETRRNDT